MLTQKAFQILHLLVKNAGQLVKKETLISEVWQDSFIEDANITQQIYILRKTLGNDRTGKPLIETLPKRGYCFVGEVLEINENSEIESASKTLPQNESSISSDPQKQKSRFVLYSLAGSLVLLILAGLFFYQSKNQVKTTEIKSIAVLPFKKIGSETDDSKIGFGLADAVINNLSKQQKIPVRSMGAVFGYANQVNVDAVQAGKRLEVDSVLEGTVQQEGEQIRVSLRLIRTNDGSTLWAETFNEKFDHIFTLQDSISNKVAQSLSMNLSGWEKPLIAKQPASAEASRFYQLGVYFSNTRSAEGLERAASYFQKVIELDPNYAPAYAMLADTYNWQNETARGEKRQELLDKSEEAAQKAITLDNSFAEAHIALAFVQFVKYKDFEGGRNSLKRAVELAPFNPTARLHYGWELLQRGDLESAYQQIVLAQENSPLSAHNNLTLCSVLVFKRLYPQALKFCQKAAELQPSTPLVNVQIAGILFLMNRTDEAINLLKLESKNESQKHSALANLAYIYTKTGKREEAEKIYLQLKEIPDSFNKYNDLTVLTFALGKKDEALANFKKMLEASAIPPNYLIFDPYWEEIFKDQDFRRLLPLK